MPSSADAVAAALEGAAAAVRSAARTIAPGRARIILIDGRSGSGKTTLAESLRASWPEPVHLVALDDLYPGWGGLARGAEIAREQIIAPVSEGHPGRWRRWDWERSAPGAAVETPAGATLIVEGSGVLTPASAALAPVRVWLESAEAGRRERALARDGETYRPHWDEWAAQEARHLEMDDPRTLATIVVDVP